MKRMLWTITAVGALAVPAGLAAAQSDDDTTVETETPTTVVCDQDQLREQLRLHDGTGDQDRVQQRLQAHECDDCEQAQIRNREQVRVETGQGDMVRTQARNEDHDGTGDMVRRRAAVEDGQGPAVREQSEDCVGCTGDQRRYQEQDRIDDAGVQTPAPQGNGR